MLSALPSGPSAAMMRSLTSRCSSRSDRDDDQHQQHAAYGNGPALALRHRHACLLVAALYTAWH
jgi:hypothetical protein